MPRIGGGFGQVGASPISRQQTALLNAIKEQSNQSREELDSFYQELTRFDPELSVPSGTITSIDQKGLYLNDIGRLVFVQYDITVEPSTNVPTLTVKLPVRAASHRQNLGGQWWTASADRAVVGRILADEKEMTIHLRTTADFTGSTDNNVVVSGHYFAAQSTF